MTTATKVLSKDLKKIPGHSMGVRVNAALRMKKLGQPICPFSKLEMERDYKGEWVAKKGPTDPTRQNCQKAGGAWWKDCEAKGHNPYFREVVWYVTEDEFDEESGEMIGTKRFRRSMQLPNIKSVAIANRINSGLGVRRAKQRKGCVELVDLGYAPVCQYRGCQEPVNPQAKSTKYGDYCCSEELALVAAEQQGMILMRPSGALQGTEESKFIRLREGQLREAASFAKDQ
jgi:hypothetical protein